MSPWVPGPRRRMMMRRNAMGPAIVRPRRRGGLFSGLVIMIAIGLIAFLIWKMMM